MIYIVRHGQTAGNKAKVLQGRSDRPLNEVGVEQAQEVRRRFDEAGVHFARVFTSPLSRAVQTASIAAGDVAQSVDERLIEMDYGPYEGMSLESPAPEVMTFFQDFVNNPAPEGMEPLREVVARLGSFFESIRATAATQDVLVSTHAIALKGALEYLTPDSGGSYWSKYIGNCAVYVTGIDERGDWLVPREWQGAE